MFCLIPPVRRPPAHLRSFALAVVPAACLVVPLLAGGAPPTRADADSMLRKVVVIATNGLSERPAARRTSITEAEVNSFLTVHAKSEIPPGVLDPVVVIEPSGRLTGRATVDLDQVREARKSEGMSVLSLLSGRVPVEAAGVLRSGDGRAQFELQSATANGIPIPKALLQEVVAYYSRSAENPQGITLDAPFELPAHIREIQTEKGQAIVVQ
jgi:hypothetical protein